MTKTIGFLVFAALVTIAAGQFGFNQGLSRLSNVARPLTDAASLLTAPFGDFKKTFNKQYDSPEEEKKRVGIFSDNQKSLLDLNKIANLPYTTKINEFGDFLSSEFNKLLNGLRIDRSKSHGSKFIHDESAKINNNVDWREKGAVTPVRSQGQCASCYAFASTAALESYIFQKTGKLEPLSPQNVMDCTQVKPYENYGCTSGAVDPTFDYVKDNGINYETAYPYEEKIGQECRYKSDVSAIKIKGYVLLDEGDEKGLEEAVVTKGPVTVGIDAHAQSWQFYGGGIYYEPKCGSTVDHINHAVLVIGYGTDEHGQKYWLIKNSYGPTWGENGFGKIARNVTNHCGIATYAVYPELE